MPRKSTSSSCTSTGICGTLCAPSATITIPSHGRFLQSPDIVSDTQNIGHLRNCHKFRLICNGISQIFFCNSSLPVTLQIFYHRTCSLGCLLPWKHITVMFHNAYQNFISRLKCHQSIAVCNQIQTFCCISCKNNLFCAFCMNKLTDFFSGSLIFLCCILRSLIESTQRICITVLHKICNPPGSHCMVSGKWQNCPDKSDSDSAAWENLFLFSGHPVPVSFFSFSFQILLNFLLHFFIRIL